MLGHPETCPHGNPIDLAAAQRRPEGVSLAALEAGERATVYRIAEAAEEDPALLSYLEARALTPGAHVTILARSESLDAVTLEDRSGGRPSACVRPASSASFEARRTRRCSTASPTASGGADRAPPAPIGEAVCGTFGRPPASTLG
jgi:hypothetical protein